MGKRN